MALVPASVGNFGLIGLERILRKPTVTLIHFGSSLPPLFGDRPFDAMIARITSRTGEVVIKSSYTLKQQVVNQASQLQTKKEQDPSLVERILVSTGQPPGSTQIYLSVRRPARSPASRNAPIRRCERREFRELIIKEARESAISVPPASHRDWTRRG